MATAARTYLSQKESVALRRSLGAFAAHTGLGTVDIARGTGMTWVGVHYIRNGRRRCPTQESGALLNDFMATYLRSHPEPMRIERSPNGNHPLETPSAQRCEQPPDFVMTAAARTVIKALDYCAERHINGGIFGDPGVGKSAAMHYWSSTTKHRHAVVFCRAYTSYSKLLRAVARVIGLDGHAAAGELDDAIHETLAGAPRLLVIDEADMLNARTLDWLRSLWDESGHRTSFLLLAKPAFYQRLQVQHARSKQDLRQLWRRLAFRKFLSGITREEMLEYLALRGLAKSIEPDAVAALHRACGGSFGDLGMLVEIIGQMIDENPRLEGRITPAAVARAGEARFGADIVRRG